MNFWNNYPKLWQIFHPWHWLTYGNNAAGLAAIVALAGLAGLTLYVLYTKRMMDSALATHRAEYEPYLMIDPLPPEHGVLRCKLHNIGRGVAIGVQLWSLEGDAASDYGKFQKLPELGQTQIYGNFAPDDRGGEGLLLMTPTRPVEERAVIVRVVQATDIYGSAHQLHIRFRVAPGLDSTEYYSFAPRPQRLRVNGGVASMSTE